MFLNDFIIRGIYNEIMKKCFCIVFLSFTVSAYAGYPEGFQAFNEGDYETAFKEYSIEAENGNSYAQADLGDMYYHGVGVDQDYEKALKWFELAAKQSHSRAQYNLGVLHENGFGTKQDMSKALYWWCLASGQGHYGADFNLAMAYYNGKGVPKDLEIAAHKFKKIAIVGIPGAQYRLGLMNLNGDGIPKNLSEAKKWLYQAYKNMDPDLAEKAFALLEKNNLLDNTIKLF